MLFASLTADDLAGRRDLKALLGARFRLHLGHFRLLDLSSVDARLGMPRGPDARNEAGV